MTVRCLQPCMTGQVIFCVIRRMRPREPRRKERVICQPFFSSTILIGLIWQSPWMIRIWVWMGLRPIFLSGQSTIPPGSFKNQRLPLQRLPRFWLFRKFGRKGFFPWWIWRDFSSRAVSPSMPSSLGSLHPWCLVKIHFASIMTWVELSKIRKISEFAHRSRKNALLFKYAQELGLGPVFSVRVHDL